LSASQTLNREKINEIGRDGTVDWKKNIPTGRLSLRQLEYGNIAFWQQLANTSAKGGNSDGTGLDLATDFKTSMIDLACFKTDDDGTFLGTFWYPKYRLASWGINIGNPQALIERSFELSGEDEYILEGSNKYLIYRAMTASGGTDETFIISDGTTYPHAVENNNNSGADGYMLRVVRVTSAGVTTDLTYTTDYTYNTGSYTATVLTTTAGDTIKFYWTAATLGTGTTYFTNNTTDAGGLSTDSVDIYLVTSTHVHKLQSASIDVSYDRTDYYELGDDEVISRGARDKTVKITLGRFLDTYTIEEALRGVSSTWGIINPRNYLDNLTLKFRFYTDSTKTTFKMGYKFTNLSPSNTDLSVPTKDYLNRNVTLEGEEGIISANTSLI
jgi:hypothetical protein